MDNKSFTADEMTLTNNPDEPGPSDIRSFVESATVIDSDSDESSRTEDFSPSETSRMNICS